MRWAAARQRDGAAAGVSQRTTWRVRCSCTHLVAAAQRWPGAAPSPGASMALALTGACARGEGEPGSSSLAAARVRAICRNSVVSKGWRDQRSCTPRAVAARRRRGGGAAPGDPGIAARRRRGAR